MDRKLVHYQTTDILNPPQMNATYKTIEVEYDNIYFPEAYDADYSERVDDEELSKESVRIFFNDFATIETEYERL